MRITPFPAVSSCVQDVVTDGSMRGWKLDDWEKQSAYLDVVTSCKMTVAEADEPFSFDRTQGSHCSFILRDVVDLKGTRV
jgi:hypothetical protein